MELTRKQLAQLFEVSIRTITTWQSDPAFPRPTKKGGVNSYAAPAVLRWWRDREIAHLVEAEDGQMLDLDQERAKLAAAQRRRTEIEIARLDRELVDAAELKKQLSGAVVVVKGAIQAVPARLAPVLAAETDADETYRKLDEELNAALSALADRAGQIDRELAGGVDDDNG